MKTFLSTFLILISLLAGCGGGPRAKAETEKVYYKAAVSYCREVQNELADLSREMRESDPAKIPALVDQAKESINRSITGYGMVAVPASEREADQQLRGLHDEVRGALHEFSTSPPDASQSRWQFGAIKLDALSRKVSMMLAVLQAKQLA